MDTEFHLERKYFIQLALVQVAVEGQVYCVDPLWPGIDIAPLEDLLEDPDVCTTLHAAQMDLQVGGSRELTPNSDCSQSRRTNECITSCHPRCQRRPIYPF